MFKNHINNEENWVTFLEENDCEKATEQYLKIIKEAHDKFFALKKLSIKRTRDKRWITKGIRISSRKKYKLYRKYLRNPSEENRRNWKKYSNCLKKICRKAESEYFNKLIGDTAGSIRKLWHTFRPILSKKKNKSKGRIVNIEAEGKIINNSRDIAKSFNEYFCGIGRTLSENIPEMSTSYTEFLGEPNKDSIFMRPVTEGEIINEINKFKDRKAIRHHVKKY
jgi:hypothetical protein